MDGALQRDHLWLRRHAVREPHADQQRALGLWNSYTDWFDAGQCDFSGRYTSIASDPTWVHLEGTWTAPASVSITVFKDKTQGAYVAERPAGVFIRDFTLISDNTGPSTDYHWAEAGAGRT